MIRFKHIHVHDVLACIPPLDHAITISIPFPLHMIRLIRTPHVHASILSIVLVPIPSPWVVLSCCSSYSIFMFLTDSLFMSFMLISVEIEFLFITKGSATQDLI